MTQRIENKYKVTQVTKASAFLPDLCTLFEYRDDLKSNTHQFFEVVDDLLKRIDLIILL